MPIEARFGGEPSWLTQVESMHSIWGALIILSGQVVV